MNGAIAKVDRMLATMRILEVLVDDQSVWEIIVFLQAARDRLVEQESIREPLAPRQRRRRLQL
jgi:hypothetical protein